MTGHIKFKLWSITFRLIELKVFSAFISKIPSVLSSLKSPCWPLHNCSDPAAWRASAYNIIITTFLAILLSTSPTPIGPGPDSLSNGINLHAMNDSRDSVFFISSKSFKNSAILFNFPMMLFQMNVMLGFFSNHQCQNKIVEIPLLLALLLSKWGTHSYLHIPLGKQVVSVLSIMLLAVVH